MAAQNYVTIFLLLADLQISKDRHLTSISGPGAALSPTKFLPLSALQHWAIQVHSRCYEVTAIDAELHPTKCTYVMNTPTIKDWEARRRASGLKFTRLKIGATRWSELEIHREAEHIWQTRFKTIYELAGQNCQNFAYLLYRRITVDKKDPIVSRAERRSWKPIPNRVTQVKSLAKKAGPYLAIAIPLELLFDAFVITNPVLGAARTVLVFASLIIPAGWLHSKDRKWLREMKKAEKELARIKVLPSVGGKSRDGLLSVSSQNPHSSGTKLLAKDLHAQHSGAYGSYNRVSVNEYVRMGFTVEEVVSVLNESNIDSNKGEYFHFDEEDTNTFMDALLEQKDAGTRSIMSGSSETLPMYKANVSSENVDAYQGYNHEIVDEYAKLGFDTEDVVLGLKYFGVPSNDGEYFQLNNEDTETLVEALAVAT